MKKMIKWMICTLLLMLLGILGGCGKKEAAAEDENLPGEGLIVIRNYFVLHEGEEGAIG